MKTRSEHPKVYFFCYPHGPAEKAGYEHQLVALAEGFEAMGITCFGNVNYWLKTADTSNFLINKNPVDNLSNFDLVLFSSTLFNYNSLHLLPDALFSKDRNYKLVFMDASDGLMTPGFDPSIRGVDLVLKCHYSDRYDYPNNFTPWQYGLTNRMMAYAAPLSASQRKPQLISSFRIDHQLRGMVETIAKQHFYSIYPQNAQRDTLEDAPVTTTDELYWRHTGRRHYPSYYKRLGESLLVNATGGYLQNKINAKGGFLNKALGKIGAQTGILAYDRIFQFDSFRFWESLIAGCGTLHINFDYFGLKLPVQPEHGKHYIGIDLQHPHKTVELLKDKTLVEQIGKQGRDWVLEWYSPEAVARRLLLLID